MHGQRQRSDFVQIQGRKNDPRATKVCARRLEQSAGRQRDRNGQGGETWGRKKTLGRKSEVGSKDLILVNSFATDSREKRVMKLANAISNFESERDEQ